MRTWFGDPGELVVRFRYITYIMKFVNSDS